jgi:hypothetical protein
LLIDFAKNFTYDPFRAATPIGKLLTRSVIGGARSAKGGSLYDGYKLVEEAVSL